MDDARTALGGFSRIMFGGYTLGSSAVVNEAYGLQTAIGWEP
jgi:hypothetical protein